VEEHFFISVRTSALKGVSAIVRRTHHYNSNVRSLRSLYEWHRPHTATFLFVLLSCVDNGRRLFSEQSRHVPIVGFSFSCMVGLPTGFTFADVTIANVLGELIWKARNEPMPEVQP
jgi:hypothetical protein